MTARSLPSASTTMAHHTSTALCTTSQPGSGQPSNIGLASSKWDLYNYSVSFASPDTVQKIFQQGYISSCVKKKCHFVFKLYSTMGNLHILGKSVNAIAMDVLATFEFRQKITLLLGPVHSRWWAGHFLTPWKIYFWLFIFALYFVSPRERPWRQRVFQTKSLVIVRATCVFSHAFRKEPREYALTSRSFSGWDEV